MNIVLSERNSIIEDTKSGRYWVVTLLIHCLMMGRWGGSCASTPGRQYNGRSNDSQNENNAFLPAVNSRRGK